MSTPCEICKGQGLVSTGAVPHEVGTGRTETCKACSGTGQVAESGQSEVESVAAAPAQEEVVAPVEVAPEAVQADVESVENADVSGSMNQTVVEPKVGDACITADGAAGTLQLEGEDQHWVCAVSEVAAQE